MKQGEGTVKCAAYLRRSTDRQDQSIEDQKKSVLKFAEERGFEIVRFYVDDAISGTTTDERKSFQEMVRDAQNGAPWRYVLVYDVKRFGRTDNDEAGYYRFVLRRAGVEVAYVAEHFSGDDTDDLLRPVKQWQARQESKDLSRVTIRGQLSLSEGGWWMGGTPPFGYDLFYHDSSGKAYMRLRFLENGEKQVLDSSGKVSRLLPRGERMAAGDKDRIKLVLSLPERVALVRRIFKMYLEGHGFKTIANRFNEEKIPSPRDGNWSRIHDGLWSMESVRAIVTNPIYVGDMVWNRRAQGRFHKISGKSAVSRGSLESGRLGFNPEDEWIIIPNAHEAIIDRSDFLRAQSIRQDRANRRKGGGAIRGRAKGSPYLLSGLLKCVRCGRNYQGHRVGKGKLNKDGERITTTYYVCGGYVAKGPAVCDKALFRQDALDEFVVVRVREWVERLLSAAGRKMLARQVERMLRSSEDDPREEIGRLRARRESIEQAADKLLELVEESNREFVNAKLLKLRHEKAQIEARLEELQRKKVTIADPAAVVEEVLRHVSRFRDAIGKGSADQRKSYLRTFVHSVEVDPDKGGGVLKLKEIPGPGSDGKIIFSEYSGGGI